MSLAKTVTNNILKQKTIMDMMEALAKMYKQPSSVNKRYLMKKIFNLKMAEGCSFMLHLSELNMIVD